MMKKRNNIFSLSREILFLKRTMKMYSCLGCLLISLEKRIFW